MKAGLYDYHEDAVKEQLFAHPDEDIEPLDFLYQLDKSWRFPPGEQPMMVSAVGYMLLGFALAQHHGATSWDGFDQRSVIPQGMQSQFQHTKFAMKGKCDQYAADGMPQ